MWSGVQLADVGFGLNRTLRSARREQLAKRKAERGEPAPGFTSTEWYR
jgi:hypothetical protein